MRAWPIASARTTRQKRVQSMTAMAMITELKPGAEHGDQQDGEQHRRKRHPDVDDARDDAVDPAAEIAGDQPEHRADQAGGDRRGEGHDEGDAAAEDQPRQQIAAEAVGAEPDSRARRRRARPAAAAPASGPAPADPAARPAARRSRPAARASSQPPASHRRGARASRWTMRAAQPWRSRGLSSA